MTEVFVAMHRWFTAAIWIAVCCCGVGCGDDPSAGVKPAEPSTPTTTPAQDPGPSAVQTDSADAASHSVDLAVAAKAKERAVASQPEQVYRPSDRRPVHDDARLAELGIRRFESTHLRLYTDIDAEAAAELPALVDQLYTQWTEYFGPLPPNREGTEFQITGYVMGDPLLFQQAGLIRDKLPNYMHGRQFGSEFWMRDQQYGYYRKHLLLHEATHCYMMTMPRCAAPLWYLEGMAELFATHQLNVDGQAEFRLLPAAEEDFPGLGRIRLLQDDVRKEGGPRSLMRVTQIEEADFAQTSAYAWCWAFCWFLDHHPRYRERFGVLGKDFLAERDFLDRVGTLFGDDLQSIDVEWMLFARNLCHGYDLERTVIDFQPAKPLVAGEPAATVAVKADQGWQPTGVTVEKGVWYEFVATGEYTLADDPKPWVSQPQGISFRYFAGQPLGKLVGRVFPPAGQSWGTSLNNPGIVPIGGGLHWQATASGPLYLRINEPWNELSDNQGVCQVTISRIADQ